VQLHGDMTQPARTATLKKFKNGEARLVVCSDVAARGLDIKDLSHVFNFDVPSHAEDYVHRIGRTGRAGQTGRAFMLSTRDDNKYLAAVEKLIKKSIPVTTLDGDGSVTAAVETPAPAAPAIATPATEARAESKPRSRRGRGRTAKPDIVDAVAADSAVIVESSETAAVETKPVSRRRAEPPKTSDAVVAEAPEKTAREPSLTGGGVVNFPNGTDRNADRGRGKGRDDRARVIGFGDEVPAFLLRPVPKKALG